MNCDCNLNSTTIISGYTIVRLFVCIHFIFRQLFFHIYMNEPIVRETHGEGVVGRIAAVKWRLAPGMEQDGFCWVLLICNSASLSVC